jgi:DNA-binding NtrC family response regulator
LALSTLVVCDAGKDKQAEIEALVGANQSMSLVGTTSTHDSVEKIRETDPKLVWIELAPNPDEGIKLLGGLKNQFPGVYYLVSNEVLNASLVKTSMQMGAVDFLDAQTWSDQLPDVIKRILQKETARVEAAAKLEEEHAKLKQTLEMQRVQQPVVSRTNLTSMKRMVTDTKEIESRAVMNFAMLIVVVVLAVGAYFVFLHK